MLCNIYDIMIGCCWSLQELPKHGGVIVSVLIILIVNRRSGVVIVFHEYDYSCARGDEYSSTQDHPRRFIDSLFSFEA